SITEDDVPVTLTDISGDVTGVVRGRIRQRLLFFPFEIRHGLYKRMQVFFNCPLGWAGNEFSYPIHDDFFNLVGIGDMRAGTTLLVREGKDHAPDIVATIDMTFPTGNASFPTVAATPDSRLGEGFFALGVSLLCVQKFDPVVLFYGGGYRHRFEHDFQDILV